MTDLLPKPKVLLVDDDPRILAGLRRQLHQRFLVATAGSGVEALTLVAAEDDFAVVVSDMRMPGMDGAAFLARVRVESPRSTRVLLTGQTELSAAVRAINDGQVFRFLSKPCPPEVLEKCLQEAVARHRVTLDEPRLSPGSVGDRRLMELNDRGEVVVAHQTDKGNRQFRLQYQPIVSLDDNGAVGVEAILRWIDPQPGRSTSMAAGGARGLHMPLGRWMTAAACQEVASWPATGSDPLGVHIKLFPGHLGDPDLIDDLAQTLILSGLEPHRVTLEVPQTLALGASLPFAPLDTISRWGVQLALGIDECPPMPSSTVQRLPFSAVKMGVRQAAHEPDNTEAHRTFGAGTELARQLGASIIADGVECAKCQVTARTAACRFAQGSYYGSPADPGDLLPGLVTGRR
ncbi:EAL domain-containing response regulator [Paractinoplanes durhamensis]|uniref:Response regulator n=1 Tax=Paractinoplanes durhamensis TaxID=113563 RepID=A0ABQ3YRF4_9ACTN|nr:EAL domain-containing protein [Actinoplanes durhamensis]GIE00173.1 hypothetical protein Adu01nite_15230 [Actinoplanes durhamensis]